MGGLIPWEMVTDTIVGKATLKYLEEGDRIYGRTEDEDDDGKCRKRRAVAMNREIYGLVHIYVYVCIYVCVCMYI